MIVRVLFLSLIKVNSEHFAVKFDGLLLRGGQDDSSRTLFVTSQGKRQKLLLRKNVTFFFTKPTCPPRKPAFGRLSRQAALE